MALDTQVPQWLVSQEAWQREDASRSTQELVQNLFEGQKLAMQRKQQTLQTQSSLLGIQQQAQNLEMGQVKLDNVAHDNSTIPKWMQEHPTWESRQNATDWPIALSPQGEQQLAQVRLRDASSVQQRAAVAAIGEFSKRVDALSKVDPIAGGQFAQYIGKANPSPQVLQALGLAEQTVGVRQQNEKDQAALDAQARGDVQTTTISDKGVVNTYKPAPPGGKETAPKTMTIDGGVQLAWVPGGKTLHVIQPSGKKQVLTPNQLLSIAKGLDPNDPRVKQIQGFLADSAVKEIKSQTPQPPVAPTPSATTNSFQVGRFQVTPQ